MWIICAVAAAILWGLNYSLAEKLLNRISPITLLTIELWLGAVIFSVIAYFTTFKRDLAILSNEPVTLWLSITESLVVLIASFLIIFSIQLKDATIAGIIELIYPLFTIFFTWFLFHEAHVNFEVILGGILIFIGVVVISLS